MLSRRCLMLWLIIVSLLGVTACGRNIESAAGVAASPTTATSQVQSKREDAAIDMPPMPTTQPAIQPRANRSLAQAPGAEDRKWNPKHRMDSLNRT